MFKGSFSALLLILLMFPKPSLSEEYYVDIEGGEVSISDIHDKSENFKGFYAVYGGDSSYFILGLINGFVFGDGSVSLDDNGGKYVVWFSSKEIDYNSILSSIRNNYYFKKYDTFNFIKKNRSCAILAVSNKDGEVINFSMIVTDGDYYNYYSCAKLYFERVNFILN